MPSGEVRPFPDVRAAQEIETRGVASSACSDLLRAAEQTLRQIDLYPGHLQNRGETARYRKRRHTVAGRWRVEKFDDDGGLRQPPRANSSFSRITLSGSSCSNSGSCSGLSRGATAQSASGNRPRSGRAGILPPADHNTSPGASFGVTSISATMTQYSHLNSGRTSG